MDHYQLPESLFISYGEIDAEHRGLIEILNVILRLLQVTGKVEAHTLYSYLEELRETLKTHFAHEEQDMADLHYPELAQHKRHHAHCFSRLDDICHAVATRQKKIDRSLLDDLFDMTLDDIIRADSGFKTFLFEENLCDTR